MADHIGEGVQRLFRRGLEAAVFQFIFNNVPDRNRTLGAEIFQLFNGGTADAAARFVNDPQ